MLRRTLWGMLLVSVFLCTSIVVAMAANCDTRPLKPPGSVCGDQKNCTVWWFAGYSWWTNYMFNLDGKGYWFKGQQWDPRLVYIDQDGLHLQMKKTLMPEAPGPQWSSTEVVLYAYGDQPAIQGYGTYLVAASNAKGTFDDLGRANCTFGAFTYQFKADPSEKNTNHELDMIETGCLGQQCEDSNAQFTLQPWDYVKSNVHRITIRKDVRDITVVMDWPRPQTVAFRLYYGIYDLDHLPSKPDIQWEPSDPNNKVCVPKSDCQPIHLNLWRGDPNRLPPGDQEVIIKKFQYRKASTEATEKK